MTWFKIDDGFHCHPKVLEAGNEAIGFWVRCGSYCAQQLTEGFVPRAVALMYGDTVLIDVLVKVGMLIPVANGWQMHDFLVYNPTKEKVEADREAAAKRQRDARERAKKAREEAARKAAAERDRHVGSHGVTHAVSHIHGGAHETDRHGVTHAHATQGAESLDLDTKSAYGESEGPEAAAEASRRDSRRESRSPRPDPTRPVLPTEVIKTSAAGAAGAEPAALFDPPAAVASAPAAPADNEPERGAGTLIAEWLESRVGNRPPGRTIGHAGKELRILLEEDHIPYETVRDGFMAWSRKGSAPSAIASFVNEAQARASNVIPIQRGGYRPYQNPADQSVYLQGIS